VAAKLIDGKALAQQVRDRLAVESAAVFTKTGVKPGLATILVGDDPASHVYVKNKQKACELAGIYVDDHKLPASTTQAELLALIEKKNADPKIHGILVQLPLPKQIDSRVVLEAVSPNKDADGFHPYNFGRLVEGHPVFEACTPKASAPSCWGAAILWANRWRSCSYSAMQPSRFVIQKQKISRQSAGKPNYCWWRSGRPNL
jgi:methylenetetrahydrofolate dehydrogenase (NADP+)/methenyltetrahydrofolate cyclohydrolase